MRIALSALACALLAALFVSPLAHAKRSIALSEGPSVKGKFEILAAESTPPRSIEFGVEKSLDGQVIGDVIFQDESTVAIPETAEEKTGVKPLFLRAQFDCLVVKANRAVMSGSITESSRDNYVGRRFLLVVQDNGGSQNPLKRDKFTFGVYRVSNNNWPISDAERPDEAAPVSWMTTDAERPDDLGSFSQNGEIVGCQTFPISAFAFMEVGQTRGTVQIRP